MIRYAHLWGSSAEEDIMWVSIMLRKLSVLPVPDLEWAIIE